MIQSWQDVLNRISIVRKGETYEIILVWVLIIVVQFPKFEMPRASEAYNNFDLVQKDSSKTARKMQREKDVSHAVVSPCFHRRTDRRTKANKNSELSKWTNDIGTSK